MAVKILRVFLISFLPFYLFGQQDPFKIYDRLHFGDRFIVGASHTYIWEPNDNYNEFRYNERTTNLNLTVNLSQRWYAGMQYAYIFTKGSSIKVNQDETNNYNIIGLYVQFDMLPPMYYKSRLYAELSYNITNYCTCGDLDPYKKSGINTVGFGLGWDYVLTKRLVLETGFYSYQPINMLREDTYNNTQYIVGLSYNFSKPYGGKK